MSQNLETFALASRFQIGFWSPEMSTLAPEVELEHSDPRVSGAGYQSLLENLVQAEQEWAGQAQLQHWLQPWPDWLVQLGQSGHWTETGWDLAQQVKLSLRAEMPENHV